MFVRKLGGAMKILTLSDLHIEFADFRPSEEAIGSADVVVLAGDIHTGVHGLEWAKRELGDRLPVVYVAGNHEYYGGHWTKTLEAMRQSAEALGIHFLENDVVVLKGVRFVGSSLFADFGYFGDAARTRAEQDYALGLMDCKRIKADPDPRGYWGYRGRRLTPFHVRMRAAQSLAWLESELQRDFAGPTVVVTHYLPHRSSVASRFVEDRLTPGFVTLVPEEVIRRSDVWIHGHTHDTMAYQLGETRVVCNPRGYPLGSAAVSFENPRFDDKLVVEV
jgi:predicted phosphodiesterase